MRRVRLQGRERFLSMSQRRAGMRARRRIAKDVADRRNLVETIGVLFTPAALLDPSRVQQPRTTHYVFEKALFALFHLGL